MPEFKTKFCSFSLGFYGFFDARDGLWGSGGVGSEKDLKRLMIFIYILYVVLNYKIGIKYFVHAVLHLLYTLPVFEKYKNGRKQEVFFHLNINYIFLYNFAVF